VLGWSSHVGWGGLLSLYGLAAQAVKSPTHLSLYAAAAAFSCAIDLLGLAAAPATVLGWAILVTKAAGVGFYIRFRQELV
jgi:hypothetical protein